MVVTRRTLALAAAVLALLVAAQPADAAKRRVPQAFFGVMWDGSVVNAPDAVQEAQWSLMARTGVESVRAVFSWDRAQPTAGSPPSFDRTDRIVTLAEEHGMRVLPVVLGTPDWAAAYSHPYSPPRHAADFGAFMRALVRRYGPAGSFWSEHPSLRKRPIRTWQIWNEPHLSYRWYAKRGSRYAWPRGYLTVLKEAHRAVKASDRGARIVLGGLTNDSWNKLRALYRRHARPYFDVAAIQTYTGTPRQALRAIRLFRAVMRRYGDGRKPMWATETGWPAAVGRIHVPEGQRSLVSTDRGMASRLRTMFDAVARRRNQARYRVGRVFWYTWSSPYRPVSDIFDYAGLEQYYAGSFKAKPALGAYRVTVRRFEGCAKDSFGACRP